MIEVGRQQAEVPKEAVEAELERRREVSGSAELVERAAADGDVLLIDYEARSTASPSRARPRTTCWSWALVASCPSSSKS